MYACGVCVCVCARVSLSRRYRHTFVRCRHCDETVFDGALPWSDDDDRGAAPPSGEDTGAIVTQLRSVEIDAVGT